MEIQDIIQENIEEQVAVFGALADPTRLKLVKLLCRQQESHALCVNAMAGLLGVTQSAISQHLRVLKSISLVKGERRGYHIHYFINRQVLEKYIKLTPIVLNSEQPEKDKTCQENCHNRREENGSPRE